MACTCMNGENSATAEQFEACFDTPIWLDIMACRALARYRHQNRTRKVKCSAGVQLVTCLVLHIAVVELGNPTDPIVRQMPCKALT
jgi:hypothetical protein